MEMTFRWYGETDPVTLEQIRQIPAVTGIVSAIYDIPVGKAWPLSNILALKKKIEDAGLSFTTIESVPVHEDIKLGKPSRDGYIQAYIETLENLGKAGIKVVCYNFMPVFDWTRSSLNHPLPDGSNALIYEEETVRQMDPLKGDLALPGWDASYTKDGLKDLLLQYRDISEETLWENLFYFLGAILPTCEAAGIKMAIHPDDPPWPIFGLPRIITGFESFQRLTQTLDSPCNGIALCSGSLGADPKNDIAGMIRHFGSRGKIHFGHVRNIKQTGEKSFEETAHLTAAGSLDIFEIMKAYHDIGFDGPIRPDHGRMIWGEQGRPGYGLYDRALGASYLYGLWEATDRLSEKKEGVKR